MADISLEMVLEYEDEETAKTILSSLEPDSDGYVEIEVKEMDIHCVARAESPRQLLHTVDDLLACVSVAEESIEKK